MSTFQTMGLPEALNHTLTHMKFEVPTPIQQQAIPMALEGKDILGSAQTGTGKTGAFGIPVIAHLMNDPKGSALIMTPTRELAAQVLKQLKQMLGQKSKIRTALLIGGESMVKQFRQLDHNPRLVVGTPGRIHDHLTREKLSLDDTKFLVLDETDRMLDMGFSIQIEAILEHMPHKRQTMLFSATLPKNIQRISENYLEDPIRIAVDPTSTPAKNIKQDVLKIKDAEKYPQLLKELDERAGSVIIFMKTKHATDKMATKLSKDGIAADAVHGDLRQSKRDRVIAAFRKEKFRVLVATDVAARGLDIPHIEHVINFDLPQCPEDYIHRIGRTARAGAEGCAVCFVSPSEKGKWARIDRLMNPGKAKDGNDFEEDDDGYSRSSRPRRRFSKPYGDRANPFGERKSGGDRRNGGRSRSGSKFGSKSGPKSSSGYGAKNGEGKSGSRSSSRFEKSSDRDYSDRPPAKREDRKSKSYDGKPSNSPFNGKPKTRNGSNGNTSDSNKSKWAKPKSQRTNSSDQKPGTKKPGVKNPGAKKLAAKRFSGNKSGPKGFGKSQSKPSGNRPQKRR